MQIKEKYLKLVPHTEAWRRALIWLLIGALVGWELPQSTFAWQPGIRETHALLTTTAASEISVVEKAAVEPGQGRPGEWEPERSSRWTVVILTAILIGAGVLAAVIRPSAKGQPRGLNLSANSNPLDFGGVRVGSSLDQVITIRNWGDQDLTVTAITLAGEHFSLSQPPDLPFTIAPGGGAELTVRFQPMAPRKRSGRVEITATNSERRQLKKLKLSLKGRGAKA
jgi:hypothetical protein